MDDIYIQIAAIVCAAIFLIIAIFQILLALGFPLGDYSWGGFHKGVLPTKLRISSMVSAIFILFIGYVFLKHSKIISIGFNFIPTNIMVWVFTVFLGLNTVGNLISKSRKEKMIMTPLTGIAFLSCLFVSIFSL